MGLSSAAFHCQNTKGVGGLLAVFQEHRAKVSFSVVTGATYFCDVQMYNGRVPETTK